jgi:hypothetical protein
MTTSLPARPEAIEGERRTNIPLVVILGDLTAFLAFGALGLASHERSLSLETIARSVLVFPAAWFMIAPWFGAFGPGPVRSALAAWLVAGVLALCARALIFDRELFTAFLAIALIGNGLFLIGWRIAYDWWRSR